MSDDGPTEIPCPFCDSTMVRTEPAAPGFVGNLLPEIPQHFNRSFGCTVSSRAHLEHLQRKHGVRDFSPSEAKGPPTWWK